ncbi:MAG: hypothetical protein ACK54T_09715 [bacterium]
MSNAMKMLKALLLAMTLGIAAAAARPAARPAQPAKPAVEPVSLPVEAVFRDMAEAYRGEPTADRITVALREPGRTAQQGTIVVKIALENPPPAHTRAHTPAPTPAPTPTPGPTEPEAPGINEPGVEPPAQPTDPAEVPAPVLIAAVELGQLRLYIHGRELTAAMTSNPTCYFQTTLTPPTTPDGEPAPTETVEPLLVALARVIGPVPALPLALAEFAPGGALPVLTPYTPDITWTSATTRINTPGDAITLTGQGRHGPAKLLVDSKTLRPISLTATISARETVLELTLSAREPDDPRAWGIDTAGRVRVDSITKLGKRLEKPVPAPAEVPVETPAAPPAEPPADPAPQPPAPPAGSP